MNPLSAVHSTESDVESCPTAEISEELLARVLEPYSYKGCRYLLDARYRATEDSLIAEGAFSIGDSVYIRSTGHFNAVELILCFNQLAYSAFAPAILHEEIAVLRGWSLEDYYQHQLSSMLIKTQSARFKRMINPAKFSARLECRDLRIVERGWRYLSLPCSIEFWDDDGGRAFGEVELAAFNIP